MMNSITVLLIILAVPFVNPAPVSTRLDAATLAENGKEAQQLNNSFQSLNASVPCNNADKACINGAIAKCIKGQWETSAGQCSKSQDCFAIPSLQSEGTELMCTNEANALSMIEACGVSGGITGSENFNSTTTGLDQTDGSAVSTSPTEGQETTISVAQPSSAELSTPLVTDTPPTQSVESFNSLPTIDPNSASTAAPDSVFVTVTLTLGEDPTTLPPVTRTISPEDLSSILSSFSNSAGQPTSLPDPTLSSLSSVVTSAVSSTLESFAAGDTGNISSAVTSPTAVSQSALTSTVSYVPAAVTSAPVAGNIGYGYAAGY